MKSRLIATVFVCVGSLEIISFIVTDKGVLSGMRCVTCVFFQFCSPIPSEASGAVVARQSVVVWTSLQIG